MIMIRNALCALSLSILFVGNVYSSDEAPLSADAKRLIMRAFDGLTPGSNVDHHVHVIGYGGKVNFFADLGPSCASAAFEKNPIYINQNRFSLFHPVLYVKTRGLMAASAITDGFFSRLELSAANDNYIRRLYRLVRSYRPDGAPPGKFLLLAMDGYYNADGEIDWNQTDILIPGDYVIRLAKCLNKKYRIDSDRSFDPFVPVASVHPSRPDAVDELKRLSSKGVRFIKWLPNTMNIDPADSRHSGFYQTMKNLDMTLISHTGIEHATEAADENQKFGSPARLKNALESGLTVIMAHSGYIGGNVYLGEKMDNTIIFMKMLHKFRTGLYGGLSATTMIKSPYPGVTTSLVEQLKRFLSGVNKEAEGELLNDRFVYGSDYPLPAVNFLNPTGLLKKHGFISAGQKRALDEIQRYNPLLFDFVLKRTIHHPQNQQQRLPASAFDAMSLSDLD